MEPSFRCLTVLILSALCSGQLVTDDPCLPQSHRELNQVFRSTGNDLRSPETPQCDNKLRRGWYKFVGNNGQGLEMPTTCPGTNTCGTSTPIWIDGQHPTTDGIVTRRLCGRRPTDDPAGGCCGYEDELFVKKCNGFYVYYLNPTFDCPSAYCAGDAKRCPANKWSSTNFEPCKDPAPVLETPPVVKGPNVQADQSFNFQCEIVYPHNDPDQVFSVLWTFNNKADPAIKPEILTGAQRVVTLSGDKLKSYINTEVGCQVVTYYTSRKERNTYVSKPNFFGVQATKLTGPNMQGTTSFNFECDITFGSTDPDQQIEVVWTFDGQQDSKIAPQIITGLQRKTALDGSVLQGHINSIIGCEARLVYNGYGIKTNFRKSNTYFAGIQIIPNRLEISDREGEKKVTVTSTIPVVCNQGPDCCLTFKMNINKKSVSLKDSCDYKICNSDWDSVKKQASFDVTLVPSRTSIAGVSREAVLSFEQLVLSGTGQYIDIFRGYQPKAVQVVVKLEAGFKCSITGDPHFTGFDYKKVYDIYQTGDYTVYAVKERDFLVQIRTWPCGGVTCTCGVVVKEKNDIIRVHGCDKPGRLTASTVDVPYKLSPGATVQRSSTGQNVGILLSSGSEIKIDIYNTYMNVYIQTPAYDKNKAVGVCGTNDGNPGNDFTHPDGTVTPVCTGAGRCIPTQFTESWRVTGSASMFVVTPKQVPEKPPSQFCSCLVNSKGKSEFVCAARQHIQETRFACKNCPVITEFLKPSPWGQTNQEPYIHQAVQPVDPNQKWPNAQGVTETQARQLCTQAIQKSQLYSRCKNVDTLVNDAMTECLGDILNGGTTDFLDSATASFTSNCQMNLARDEKNYKAGPDGDMTLNPEVNELVCPVECLTHGRCGQGGKCECQTGWEGETCHIEKGKGPQINYTTGGPLCTASLKSCESVQFDKSNVNIFDKLKCRVQAVDKQGKTTGQPVILDAPYEASTRVTCPLPKTDLSAQNYRVSVTTDGITYGNEQSVQTFDPTCLDCDVSGCKPKKTACHISNVCYRNGETNKNNQKQVCDISKSLTTWSVGMAPKPESSTTTAPTTVPVQTIFANINAILEYKNVLMQQLQELIDILKKQYFTTMKI